MSICCRKVFFGCKKRTTIKLVTLPPARQTAGGSRVSSSLARSLPRKRSLFGSILSTAPSVAFVAARSTPLARRCSTMRSNGRCGVAVAADVFEDGAGRPAAAQAIRDVARMAQARGEMPFEDVGVQVFRLPAANGLDEVGKVVFQAAPPADLLAVLVERDHRRADMAGDDHVAAFAMDDQPDARAEELVHFLGAGLRRAVRGLQTAAGPCA